MTKYKKEDFKEIPLKRLWKGKADARDYIVEQLRERGMGICFVLDQDRKYVLPDKMDTGTLGAIVTAKFPLPTRKTTYQLVSWNWNVLSDDPNEEVILQEEFPFCD